MKIGIIVAMGKEMRLLLPHIEHVSQLNINGQTYYSGIMGRHEVVATQCGIGKVNAAIGTLTLIENFHPDMVVNTGVAGGTGITRVLDVVMADRIAYHDVWCGPDTLRGQASGCPRFFISPLADDVAESLGAKHGLIASGDIFVNTPEEVATIKALYPDVMAVDMESAAIAHVCHLKAVPFVCLRVISDTPGAADNIEQYDTFWDDAPEHTFKVLTQLLERI